jgi:hypothetical protein
MSVIDGSVQRVSPGKRPSRRYRYEWALFTDWCAATDTSSLPVSPIQLAEFLSDNPAGDAVQLRRVSAINHHHRTAGVVPPGTATAIRFSLDSVRADRIRRRGALLHSLALALPAVGGIEALFGRRDAVLLVLAGAGLSCTAISMLDCDVVSVDGDDLWIDGDHRLRINACAVPGRSPAAVWERWFEVLQLADRYPSTNLIIEHLQRGAAFADMSSWPVYTGPVAIPIDRWGHMPFPVDAMSAAAIADLVHAHLTGAAPPRTSTRTRPRRPNHIEAPTNDGAEDVVPELVSPVLDDGYYDAGVAARRRAHDELSGVSALFDDVEDRIEQLLQRTLDILSDTEPSETPDF